MQEQRNILEVSIEGGNTNMWEQLKSTLSQKIMDISNMQIDSRTKNTVKEETLEYISTTLKAGKDLMNTPGINNEKTLAEIELTFAKRAKEMAEARKIEAEANSLELNNEIKKIQLLIMHMRFTAYQLNKEGDLLFLKEMDDYLNSLKRLD